MRNSKVMVSVILCVSRSTVNLSVKAQGKAFTEQMLN